MAENELMHLEDLHETDILKQNIEKLEQELMKNHRIDPNLYIEYDVKRGLRDSAGKGVLTEIGRAHV